MTAQTAETARQVADIIDFQPDEFDMSAWELTMRDSSSPNGCHTTRCIAGWVSHLHSEPVADMRSSAHLSWKERQGKRLGLDNDAADFVFRGLAGCRSNTLLSNLLRDIAKESEDRDDDNPVLEATVKKLLTEQKRA